MCKSKVIDEEEKGYRCCKCDQSFKEANPTWNFTFRVSDYSDSGIYSLMGDAGDLVIGMTAKEFCAI